MLETHRFVGMLATVQPPYQLVREDTSPEKVVTIFMLRIYFTQPMLSMCIAIHAHRHTPSQHTGLLERKSHYIRSNIYNYSTSLLDIHSSIVALSVTSYIRHKENKLEDILS